jgi:hypothetical protein
MLAFVPRPLLWLLGAVALVSACSDDDDARDTTAVTTTEAGITVVDVTAAPGSTDVAATGAPTSTAAPGAATTAPTTPPPVPGSTSEDPACRAAGDFFSSLNALIYPLSTSFLDDPQSAQDFATLEVFAAPSFLASGPALEGAWPASAAAELSSVKAGFLDPFLARQQAAVGALTSAGVTPAEQEQLITTWQALATSGGTSTAVGDVQPEDVGVEAGLAAKLDQAATALLAAQGPLLESGVFGNNVTYPQLEQYLTEACPDVAELVASNF